MYHASAHPLTHSIMFPWLLILQHPVTVTKFMWCPKQYTGKVERLLIPHLNFLTPTQLTDWLHIFSQESWKNPITVRVLVTVSRSLHHYCSFPLTCRQQRWIPKCQASHKNSQSSQSPLLKTWGNLPPHPTSIIQQVTSTLTSKHRSHGSFISIINTAGLYYFSILFLSVT